MSGDDLIHQSAYCDDNLLVGDTRMLSMQIDSGGQRSYGSHTGSRNVSMQALGSTSRISAVNVEGRSRHGAKYLHVANDPNMSSGGGFAVYPAEYQMRVPTTRRFTNEYFMHRTKVGSENRRLEEVCISPGNDLVDEMGIPSIVNRGPSREPPLEYSQEYVWTYAETSDPKCGIWSSGGESGYNRCPATLICIHPLLHLTEMLQNWK